MCRFLWGLRGKKFLPMTQNIAYCKVSSLLPFRVGEFNVLTASSCYSGFWKEDVHILLGNHVIWSTLGNKDPKSLHDQLAKIRFQRDSMPQNLMPCPLCFITIVFVYSWCNLVLYMT